MPDGPSAIDGARWSEAMLRGDYAAAWAISDAVLAARDHRLRNDPRQPYHCRWVWDGTDPAGRDVLIRCYHGLGDTLQYARFLPSLAAAARTVTVETPPALLPLFQASGIAASFVPFDPAQPLPPSSCDIEIMELSHALRIAPDRVESAYLRIAQSGNRAPPATIGLCWRAGTWDSERSIALHAVLPCLPPHGRIICLQPDLRAEERGLCHFANDDSSLATISATASLIAATAWIVTVDTMIAHLAGALGHPAIVLLKRDADWRWEAGGRTGWYPEMRLLRQQQPSDWHSVLAQLKSTLVQRAED
jgi:hypothetical protein